MPSNGRTQEERVLARLVAAYPGEVSALELSAISLQYSARVHSLRAKGIEIGNRVETRNGVKYGFFRLVSRFTKPLPKQYESSSNARALSADPKIEQEKSPTLFEVGPFEKCVYPD
jgi:hypothetical protein